MKLPRGTLIRSRVVSDPATPLVIALDKELTGYAVLEPQDALLLDSEGKGVVTFEKGVPVLAYHTGTDRGGPKAVADLAVPGPYRVEVYELAAEALSEIHEADKFEGDEFEADELRIPPAMAADRLAGDPNLAERTRAAAPEARQAAGCDDGDEAGSMDAVEAFLEDTEKIEAIREQAREEATERAEQWGLGDELQ